jgi:hypothetical protein
MFPLSCHAMTPLVVSIYSKGMFIKENKIKMKDFQTKVWYKKTEEIISNRKIKSISKEGGS